VLTRVPAHQQRIRKYQGVETIAFTLGFHITHAESSWAEAGSVELQATLQAELDTDP